METTTANLQNGKRFSYVGENSEQNISLTMFVPLTEELMSFVILSY